MTGEDDEEAMSVKPRNGKRKNSVKKSRRITAGIIHPRRIIESVGDDGSGAVVLFLGTVRDSGDAAPISEGKVTGLHYESYIAMAEEQMKEIEDETAQRWPIKKIKTIHRIGELSVGDISIAVCVSSAHRREAFEACQHALECIKNQVPIWKMERIAGGARIWVKGRHGSAA